MALEQLMERMIASLDANTTAHKGTPPKATGTAATTGKPAATAKADPKVTFEAVKAAALKVKAKSGQPVTKKIIADAGKAESLNSVKPEHHAALLAALEAHLAAEAEEPEAEPEEEEL